MLAASCNPQHLIETMSDIETHWVWQQIDSALADELVQFWSTPEGIPVASIARARVADVIMVARGASGQLIGVTSMELQILPVIEQPVYLWRQFVRSDMRQSGVSSRMGIECWNILNKQFAEGKTSSKGVAVIVESKILNEQLKAAVLSPVPFVLMAYTSKSEQVRICYFDGARI
jgi:hypothetical protein